MSDTYQAVYDAVRSKIQYCDVASIVQDAARNALDASFAIQSVQHEFLIVASEMQRPSVIYKPTLELKGDYWVAHYGDAEGLGKTPATAMLNFDQEWNKS